jgi:hypothetical protein
MQGIIRDSSGKMAFSDLCGPTSTGAKAWNAPGTTVTCRLISNMPICSPPCDTPGIQNQDSSITAWVNYAVTPQNTPSEEWCALRELRVTDRDGHLPRCEQEDGARHSFYRRGATCGVRPAPRTLDSLSRHGSDSNSIGSPASFHALIPPTTSVAFKSPISCSDAAANELV